MKLLTVRNRNTFLNLNSTTTWLTKLKTFSGDCFYLLCSWLQIPVLQTQLSRIYEWMDARQISRDGRVAFQIPQLVALLKNAITEFWTNKRLRLGFMIGVVAVPSWMSHLFFDIDARIDGFYYVNYVFYFNTIRGYLAFFFITTGFFVAMPQKWALRWWLVPVAIFCASEVYRVSQFDFWKDFYTDYPSWQMFLVFGLSVPALYVSINYMLYRKYHLKDGTSARLIGVVKCPGISVEEKMKMMEKLVEESEEFNARI
jgi:hypothetical protein